MIDSMFSVYKGQTVFSIFNSKEKSLASILDLLAATEVEQMGEPEMDTPLARRLFRIFKLPSPVLRDFTTSAAKSANWSNRGGLTTALERCVKSSLFTRDKFIKLADMCTDFKISDLVKDQTEFSQLHEMYSITLEQIFENQARLTAFSSKINYMPWSF